MSLTLNFQAGNNKQYIEENELYSPSGIEILYGFKDGLKKYVYGDEEGAGYGGLEQTGGLHSVRLSRPLSEGESVVVHWRNGYELVFFSEIIEENGVQKRITKVKKRVGGTYQEVGKWADESGNSEYTTIKFNDDIYTKRFDYIETKNFKEF